MGANRTHLLRPYGRLYFPDVGLPEEEHAKPGLTDSSADTLRKLSAKEFLVEIKRGLMSFSGDSELAEQGLTIYPDAHRGELETMLQNGIPDKDVSIESRKCLAIIFAGCAPVVIVSGTAIMFASVSQRAADTDHEHRSELLANRILALFGTQIGEATAKLLGMYEMDFIRKDRLDGIRTYLAGETTLNYAFDRYLALKYDLKPSTKTNYMYIYEHFVRRRLGRKLIRDLRYSDIRLYYSQLIVKEKVSPSTVENIHTLINPVLSMAVRDGIIRNNPADGLMKEIKRSSLWKKGARHPLSIEESAAFLDYVESSPIYNHWLTLFVVFFGTGMRVSEVCGLRWEDIDFDKNEVNVNHTIVYRKYPDEETGSLHVSTTKSEKGNRIIPMVGEVKEALLAE